MKKARKLLAFLIAVVMTFSMSMTAFATDGEITGDGSTVMTDMKKTLVELPTGNTMGFTLDPQGLASANYSGGKIDASDLVANEDIVLTNKKGAMVVNKSSYPIVVTVSAKATGDAIPVVDDTALKADTKNNVLLWVEASTAKTAGSTAATTDFAGTVKAIDALSKTDKQAYFALEPAVYEVTQSGTDPDYTYAIALKTGEDGDGTKIQIGGQINIKADWSDYAKTTDPKKVGVAIKFTYAEGTGDAVDFSTAANYITDAYRLIDTTKVTVTPASSGPSFSPAAGTWALNDSDKTYTISLGTGADAAASIDFPNSTVKYTTTAVSTKKLSEFATFSSYDATNKTVTIKAGLFANSALKDDVVITIILKDSSGTSMTPLTITIPKA